MYPIFIVLTDSFSDWEIAPLAGIGRAFFGADISFVSPDGGPLTSAAGLAIADTERFDTTTKGVIVVCGGPVFESNAIPDIDDRLRTASNNGWAIAGICGGTVALAHAGLLDNLRHTSNGPGYLDALVPQYDGADKYIDQPFAMRDDNIITAPTPAPASFAVEVLVAAGLDFGEAKEIKNMLAKEHIYKTELEPG